MQMRVPMVATDHRQSSKLADQHPTDLPQQPRGDAWVRSLKPDRPLVWFDRLWTGLLLFNVTFGLGLICVVLTS
jgi:hypothetical protein